MQLITNIKNIREELRSFRYNGKTIGFVPTMGCLHQGHLQLVEAAKKQSDVVVVSIFVNPKQFCEGEDYEIYPRTLEADMKLLEDFGGVDYIFAPTVEDMWPEDNETLVMVPSLSSILIGITRPGHFEGVTRVVAKLFNIVQPTKAFFGEKDFQQLTIIRRMVKDLDIDVEVVGVPIYREEDGVAASSRNVFLSPEDRIAARVLNQSLLMVEKAFKEGEKDSQKLKQIGISKIESEPRAKIETFEILDAMSLQEVKGTITKNIVILLSVEVGSVRLLDQLSLEC